MKAFGIATLGGDMEVKYLQDGTPIGEISLAVNFFSKKEKCTQWIKATMFGARVDKVSQYMTKGSRHGFHLSDVHNEEWTDNEGATRVTMRARIDDIEFGQVKASEGQQQPSRQDAAPKPQAGGGSSGFDDMDQDIPF